nr:MAG TPA: translation initiation factor-like protein [Caudoviricetes sp.]
MEYPLGWNPRGTRVRYPRGCRNSPLGYTPVGTP